MNADDDGDVYCSPTVCVAYPPNMSRPAISPARTSMRRSGPRVRNAPTVTGASTNVASPNRPTRYANGVMSSSASWTIGNVRPYMSAAPSVVAVAIGGIHAA